MVKMKISFWTDAKLGRDEAKGTTLSMSFIPIGLLADMTTRIGMDYHREEA